MRQGATFRAKRKTESKENIADNMQRSPMYERTPELDFIFELPSQNTLNTLNTSAHSISPLNIEMIRESQARQKLLSLYLKSLSSEKPPSQKFEHEGVKLLTPKQGYVSMMDKIMMKKEESSVSSQNSILNTFPLNVGKQSKRRGSAEPASYIVRQHQSVEEPLLINTCT